MPNDVAQYYLSLKRYTSLACRVISDCKAAIIAFITIITVGLEVLIITSFYSYHHAPQLIPVALGRVSIRLISILLFFLLMGVIIPYGASFLAGLAYSGFLGPVAHKDGDDARQKGTSAAALVVTCILWVLGALAVACGLPYAANSKVWTWGLFFYLPAFLWIPTSLILALRARSDGATRKWGWLAVVILTGAFIVLLPINIIGVYLSVITHRYLGSGVPYDLRAKLAIGALFILAYTLPNGLFVISALKARWGGDAVKGFLVFALLTYIGVIGLLAILPQGSVSGLMWRASGYGGYHATYTKPGQKPRPAYVLLEAGRDVYISMGTRRGAQTKNTKGPIKHEQKKPEWPIVKRVPFNDVTLTDSP